MYEDVLDDPDVQEVINQYDGERQNDVPLDQMGNPIEAKEIEDNGAAVGDGANADEELDKAEKDTIEDKEQELDETTLEDFIVEVPDIDYTPQTEFGKSIDLSKIDDGFQKYVLSRIEPLSITDEEGKTVRAYTAEDIPNDFKFANQLDATKASTALARIEASGEALKKEYDSLIEKRNSIAAENELRTAQYEGISEAIKNGELPKLELNDDGSIDEEGKVNKLVSDIIDFQDTLNEGRSASRAISFDTALNRFKRENPKRFEELEKKDDTLKDEDKQRLEYAKRTSRSPKRSSTTSDSSKYDNLTREEFDDLVNDPDFDIRQLL